MSREGFYWHLRDKSRSWVERTKLLRYAWKHDTILLPNKYQTLLDLLVFGLNDRKKWPASDVSALWACLSEVLQTPQCRAGNQAKQGLVLKSATLQIFQEELTQSVEHTRAHGSCTESCDVIISCCLFALTSPSLGSVFTGKPDILVSHLSSVLSLANLLTNKELDFPVHLHELITILTTRCQQAIRQRAQPQQNLGYISSRLLEPALGFLYGQQQVKREETGVKLKEVLSTVLFHRDLLPHYELYLKLKVPQTETKSEKTQKSSASKLPKSIDNVFSKLRGCLNSDTAVRDHLKSHTGVRDCAVKYLPEFYAGFVKNYKEKLPAAPLQLLKLLLVELKGIPIPLQVIDTNPTANAANVSITEVTSQSPDDIEGHLKVVVDLVDTLNRLDVYDLGTDDSGSQLKWFKSLASWILSLETRCPLWYTALNSLLQLDHSILEPKLTSLLTKALDCKNQEAGSCTERDVFLCGLVDLFLRLRQMSRFTSRLLHVLRERGARAHVTPECVSALMRAVGEMPPTLVYEVWEMFAAEINPGALSGSICSLFAKFLLHLELTDHNMARITELSQTLWQDRLMSVLEVTSGEGGQDLAEMLSLLHSFGELQILLRYYHPLYTQNSAQVRFFQTGELLKSQQEPTGLVYTFSDVSQQVWKKCRKQAKYDGQIHVAWLRLELQQLKAVTLFEEIERQDDLRVAMETMRQSVYKAVQERRDDKVIHDQMTRMLVEHISLLTNQVADSESADPLYPIMLEGMRSEGRGLGGCVYIQEDQRFHRLVLSEVQTRIDRKMQSTMEGKQDSPRKKRKLVPEVDLSLADIISRLVQYKSASRDELCLQSEVLEELMSCLKDQSSLPLEFLSRENTELCLSNVLKVFQLLHSHPVTTRSNQLELVETCYRQLALSLSNCLQYKGDEMTLTQPDILKLATFMMRFHGSLPHWTSKLSGLYEYIVTTCLKPLMRTEEGLVCLEEFVNKVKVHCESEEMERKKWASLVTLEFLITSLAKNTSKQQLAAEVTSLSTDYLHTLAHVLFSLLKTILTQNHGQQQHCCILGGFAELVQASKTEQLDTNVSELITPVYMFCLHQLSHTKEVPVLRSCVDVLLTFCRHYPTLLPHLPTSFLHDTWESLATTAAIFGQRRNASKCCENYYSKERGDCKVRPAELLSEGAKSLKRTNFADETDGDVEGVVMETDVTLVAEEEGDLVALVTSIERCLLAVVSVADMSTFNRILEGLSDQLDFCSDPGRTLTSLRLWSSLVTSELTQSQWSKLAHLIQKMVVRLQSVLVSTHRSPVSTRLTETTLHVLSSFLAQGPVLLSPQSVAACLHSCIHTPLLQTSLPLCCYTTLHKAVYSLLNQMLIHHPKVVASCVPAYLAVVRLFVSSLVRRGHQGNQPRSDMEERQLVTAAHLVERLLTLVSTHKDDFGRVAGYIVADYVNEVQKVTLSPQLKKALLPGVYHILGLCDNHAIAQLYTVLSPGVKDIFRTLHQEYNKYFKYTGKV